MPERTAVAATSPWSDHLLGHVLPWWERAVRPGGGVATCWTNDGRRASDDLYTWSQGRWAWLAAELAEEGAAGRLDVDADLWRRRAVETAAFLHDHVLLGDGTVVFRTDASGRHLADDDGALATSVFADLFVALGFAGAARVADPGDARRLAWVQAAETVLEAAERSIADGTAAQEPYPVPSGYADLAGPMSLLHTASELLRATTSHVAHGVRDRAEQRLDEAFLGTDSWWEFRPDDASDPRDPDTMLARHRTPGHLLELVWMIVHAREEERARADAAEGGAALVPPPRFDDARLAALARRALAIGRDGRDGGIFRYVDVDGGPPRARTGVVPATPGRYEQLALDTWDTKLWWVHVEALYAARLLGTRTGDAALTAAADELAEYTLRTFPDPGGEWLQVRARDGSPLDRVVALPVKDPFHTARSLLLLHRTTLERQDQTP